MNSFLTGKRVYKGASQSPNRGQVSAAGATGYIKRELRKNRRPVGQLPYIQHSMRAKKRSGVVTPVGRDGKSDNRSAVAARALARMRGR